VRPLSRPDPVLSPASYKTYAIIQPEETHFRSATCEEVQCGAYERGWKTRVDETTELGQMQAAFIRVRARRRFHEEHNVEGMTDFVFPPGQECFAEHKISLERPPLFLVRGGDWRANPRGERRLHTRADLWVEDFAEHQDRLSRAQGD
jgi:hypothetical protein